MGAVSIRTLDVFLYNLEYELEIIERKSSGFGIPTLDELKNKKY